MGFKLTIRLAKKIPTELTVENSSWLTKPGQGAEVGGLLKGRTFLGLDFGTSTTVVSYVASEEAGRIRAKPLVLAQPDEYGGTTTHHLVNSVLAWRGGRLLWGREAYNLRQRLTEGVDFFTSFKMGLGVDIGPTWPETALGRGAGYQYAIEDANDAATTFFKFLLSAVKEALRELGLPDDFRLAVSVPASFEANQRADLVKDLTAAGFGVEESCLIDEPNAAFLSYIQELVQSGAPSPFHDRLRRGPANVLVYDFGAGTCDVSILEFDLKSTPVRSRNKAISRFTALGGDDFDREIASRHLLAQLLKGAPDLEPDSVEREELIIPKLRPAAEILKIVCLEWLDDRGVSTVEAALAHGAMTFSANPVPEIKIRGRGLGLEKPSLSVAELVELFRPSFDKYDPVISTRHVFGPVDDALRKSGLGPGDLEAVLFIGGSSENPLVRSAVMSHLPKTVKALVPRDLRGHVSAGAAIHSLGYHGFGFDFIRPVTSEPISVVTTGNRRTIIIPASAEVPSPPFKAVCRVGRKGQKVVELPICVGSESKLLGVLRFDEPQGFAEGEEVLISGELTHDKLLLVEVAIGDREIKTAFLNPLANHELSDVEKRLLEAKRRFNLARLKNGGRPTKQSTLNYADSAWGAGAYKLSAELYAAVERLDPGSDYSTMISCGYDWSGYKEQSHHWSRVAYQRKQNALTAYNLSVHETGEAKESLLRQSLKYNPKFDCSLYSLGSILEIKNDINGKLMLKECYKILIDKLKTGDIGLNMCINLQKLAKKYNDAEIIDIATKEIDRLKSFSGSLEIFKINQKNLVDSNDWESIIG